MLTSLLAAVLMRPAASDPYNYTGKLTEFMSEGAKWGMPTTGLPMAIVVTKGGTAVGPQSFSLKGPKWASEANLDLKSLTYAGGVLTGNVHFANSSGCALDAVRFDIASATERYKGKNSKGEEVEMTRALPVAEESPILLGDLRKGDSFDGADFKATGLAWKPETISITVTAKLSGLTYVRDLFEDHVNSTLDFDSKGRLVLGSGQQGGFYRANLEAGTVDMIASMPSEKVRIAANPIDGTFAASSMNAHGFTLFSPGGDQAGTINEGELEGMVGWPSAARFDGKGNLYACFGEAISQFKDGKPTFVLKKAGAFDFAEYLSFDVARDGALLVGSNKNVFKFDPGGKNGRLIINGPSEKLGRVHDIVNLRVDGNGYLWIAEPLEDTFMNRISVFDANGKFVWVFGRGGPAHPAAGDPFFDGQTASVVSGIAISNDGRAYIACYEQTKSVMEFYLF